MAENLARELANLQRLTTGQLRARYLEVFGEETPASNKPWLIKRIAWRLQALAEGDLSERARRRALELANDADLRLSPPRAASPALLPTPAAPEPPSPKVLPFPGDTRLPPPGTVLVRPYKGKMVQVKVLADGFEYDAQVYASLSAVAKAITGSHCNGFHFFKGSLNDQGVAE